MNCNCLSEVAEKIKGAMNERLKDIKSVECGTVAFTLGGSVEQRIYVPFRVKADAPKFRGAKGGEITMLASFCPFCGKPATKDAPANGDKNV